MSGEMFDEPAAGGGPKTSSEAAKKLRFWRAVAAAAEREIFGREISSPAEDVRREAAALGAADLAALRAWIDERLENGEGGK